VLLSAQDVNGQQKIIRRKIVLSEDPAKVSQKAAAAKDAKQPAAEDPALNYKAKRLWTKPARTMKEGSAPQRDAAPQTNVDQGFVVDPNAYPYGAAYDPNAAVPVATPQAPAPVYNPYAPTSYDQGAQSGYNTVNMPYPSQEPAYVPDSAANYDY
jgi:hypothetical protein